MPGSLPASKAELEGPCWGWRVQASPLPLPAYWSMLGKRKGGGMEPAGEGESWESTRERQRERMNERAPRKKRGKR